MTTQVISSTYRLPATVHEFESQFHIVISNIYRTPSGSKCIFLTELTDLIMSVGINAVDRFVLCGDFNMPVSDLNSIDTRLETIFDAPGIKQHMTNMDLLVTSTTATVISEVVLSHHLLDHAFVICRLSCRRVKLPATSYTYP